MVKQGYVDVPAKPGWGAELNEGVPNHTGEGLETRPQFPCRFFYTGDGK